MKKLFLVALVIAFCISGIAFAAVEIKSAGTVIGKTETIDMTGPTIAKDTSLSEVNIDLTDLTDLTVAGDIYAESDIRVDASIYVGITGGTEGALWMKQPDGGCSRCSVDAAGTTLTCADNTCPSGI